MKENDKAVNITKLKCWNIYMFKYERNYTSMSETWMQKEKPNLRVGMPMTSLRQF